RVCRPDRASVARSKATSTKPAFGARDQQGRIVQATPGSILPPCDVNNGKIRRNRMQAPTNRCDVFSSASRGCAGRFVTRSVDFLGESLGVCQRVLDEHARPPEVARRLSTDLVSSCTARTPHTATRWPVKRRSRRERSSYETLRAPD